MKETYSYTIQYNNSSTKTMIIFGAIGGIVAGLVMAPFMMLTALLVGMPANTMPIAIGLAFGADATPPDEHKIVIQSMKRLILSNGL